MAMMTPPEKVSLIMFSGDLTKNPHIFPANLYSPGQHPKKVVNFTFPGDRMSEKLPMNFLWVNYSLVN